MRSTGRHANTEVDDMNWWKTILGAFASSLSGSDSTDAKIQIRAPGDSIWRDFGYIASNTESVQNALELAALSNPGYSVRAVSRNGSIIDFR